MKRYFLTLIFLFVSFFVFAQNDYIIAENYFRNNEFEKASTVYKKLVNKSPYNTTFLRRLVTCYQEIDSFQLAEKLLQSKLKSRPNLSYINVLLGYNFERQQQQEIAQNFYNKAIQSIDKNPVYAATIANEFKQITKLKLAIEAYKKASKKNKRANYGFQIAQIYGEQGEFAKMFEEYINFVDKNANYLKTVKRYTARYVSDDSENENNILFKKALLRRSASNPKNEWNNLLSWLFTKQKDYRKAFVQEKALYNRNSDNLIGIKELGQISFENKQYEVANNCFNFIIEKAKLPRDRFGAIYYNLQIAVATKQADVDQKFQQIFTEYGININTFPIQISYADYLTFTKNKPEEAKKVLEKALKFAKTKYEKAKVKLQLADIFVYQNKFNKALIYFSQVQSKIKNHPIGQQARFKVAQTSYFKNDFKWAKAQLKVLKSSATQLISNDAAALFLTISDNQPKDSIPTGLAKFAKADLLSYQNKFDKALSILSDLVIDFKGQPIEDEALFKQAQIFAKKEQYQNAIDNYKNVVLLDKEGILVDDSLYQLAEIYNNKLNNEEKAKEYYQKIIFDYPSSIYLVDARKKYRKLRGDNI